MIETIEIELNGLEYQVEIDIDKEYFLDDDDDESMYNLIIDVLDVYLIRNGETYRVTNEYTLEEINNLDLTEYYYNQCL